MDNKISVFLSSKGYSNAVEGDYKIKEPLYSKCNINMTKSGEHQFHRFLPDIDLSLHGEDFEYFESLKPIKGEVQKIFVRLIVERYLGSKETKVFTGIVSRKCTEWDFDRKKASLNIEWQDGYSALLNNLDTSYNVLKLGVKSKNANLFVPPIIQLYMEGSNTIDNYVGGEHFEGQGDGQISLDDLTAKYHFGAIGQVKGFGGNSKSHPLTDSTLKVIATKAGCVSDAKYSPAGKYLTYEIPSGFGFDSLRASNNKYYSLDFRPIFKSGDSFSSVDALKSAINNLPDTYYKNPSQGLRGTDGSTFSDLSTLISKGKLSHTIGYVALYSHRDDKDAGHSMVQLTQNDRKIELFVFYGINNDSDFTITNNFTTPGTFATLKFNTQSALLGRLVSYEKNNNFSEPYCGFDILKDDPFMDSGHIYKSVTPLNAYIEGSTNDIFRQVEFEISSRYESDDDNGANEYGCFTDTLGENKYYIPPTGYYKKNKGYAWYPVQRCMWGSVSFWVRFAKNDNDVNFWSGIGYWANYLKIKDVYGFDSVIKTLFSKFEDHDDIETTVSGIKMVEESLHIREMRPIRNPDWIIPFFSEFFEYLNNKLRLNQYRTPFITPASNVIVGTYDQAAQVWNLSLKDVFGWLRDIFNVYPVIRYWHEEDIDAKYTFPYLTFENLAFFEQGHTYGWDDDGLVIDITQEKVKDKFNKKGIMLGLDKSGDESSNLPLRYEFGGNGGGKIFNAFDVDMGYVSTDTFGRELILDPILKDKCSTKKINPTGIYTDTDRILANPNNFDKGQSVLLMLTQFDDGHAVCGSTSTVIYDGKNGKKPMSVGNFNSSWMNLSKFHTRFAHTLDEVFSDSEKEGVLSDTIILPYIDLINNGELMTEARYNMPSPEWGSNPYADLLIGKTSKVNIELPLIFDELVDDKEYYDVHEYLYAFKITLNGKSVKGITESGEINLLTGMAKFKLKTRPML